MTYREIHDNFIKYKKDDRTLANLHDEIKSSYLEIKDLNITKEEIYVKEKLDDYVGPIGKELNEGIKILLSGLVTLIVSALVAGFIGKDTPNNVLIEVDTTIIIFLVCILVSNGIMKLINKKKIKKEKKLHFYYIMCLDVLNEIENERKNDNTPIDAKELVEK